MSPIFNSIFIFRISVQETRRKAALVKTIVSLAAIGVRGGFALSLAAQGLSQKVAHVPVSFLALLREGFLYVSILYLTPSLCTLN